MTRRNRNCPPEAQVAIFVEGGDDEKMVQALSDDTPCFIQVFHGSDTKKMANQIAAATKDPNWSHIQHVGVVVDAGEDPDEAFERALTVFDQVGFPRPAGVGTVEAVEEGRVGCFIVPGEGAPGGSETLLLQTLDPSMGLCLNELFACTGQQNTTKEQLDKARAWAWAATQGPVRPDMLWHTHVDLTHPRLQPLRTFLSELISP